MPHLSTDGVYHVDSGSRSPRACPRLTSAAHIRSTQRVFAHPVPICYITVTSSTWKHAPEGRVSRQATNCKKAASEAAAAPQASDAQGRGEAVYRRLWRPDHRITPTLMPSWIRLSETFGPLFWTIWVLCVHPLGWYTSAGIRGENPPEVSP